MEANFFRFAADELFSRIKGWRIQKVYMPGPNLYTMDLGRAGNLILACSRRQGFFYLSSVKPPNPEQPASKAMWLRKHLKNRHILETRSRWVNRSMAFELSGQPRQWLILDLLRGPGLVQALDPEFDEDIVWPKLEQVKLHDEIWKTHPHISPPLRKELSARPPEKAEKLLARLSSGHAEGFFICRDKRDNSMLSCFKPSKELYCQGFGSALEACENFGRSRLDVFLPASSQALQDKRDHKRRSKLEKQLRRIEEDRSRLKNMVLSGEKGRLIQSSLYRLKGDEKTQRLKIADHTGTEHAIELDGRLSIQENMEKFFRMAAKGKRGLKIISQRESDLLAGFSGEEKNQEAVPERISADRKGERKTLSGTTLSRRAHVFCSSDGHIILRARNSRMAGDLLRDHASSYDLWFHVQDGPGAHTILKRHGKDAQVPEKSMREAACLAALASYQKKEQKGRVMCAMVRDVRPVKGGSPGQVKVDKILETLVVYLDPGLEERLKK